MIRNGISIRFLPGWGDTDKVFTVSQWDGYRGWAGDEHGFGWYFTASQIEIVDIENEEIDDDDEEAYA